MEERTKRISVYINQEEWRTIYAAAGWSGLSMSEFVRQAALDTAKAARAAFAEQVISDIARDGGQ